MLRLLTYRTQKTNDWNFMNLLNTDFPVLLEQKVKEDFGIKTVICEGNDMSSKPPHIGKQHR